MSILATRSNLYKSLAKEALASGVLALAQLQDKLYAQDKWDVLLIFQAMDAARKDGAIKQFRIQQ
jgi:polyphosphate kinase 2 (PPK2 family)